MGQVASQSAAIIAGRPRPARRTGGTRRSAIQTGLFSGLVVSGLWIWLRPGDGMVVLAHVGGGLVLTAMLAGWLWRHVPDGLARSQRRFFTRASWALLASWLVLIGSGLVMVLPAALWLLGVVWFPQAGVTRALSVVHLWISFAATAGLVAHLGLRHWLRAGK